MRHHILTGTPGAGKTTVLRALASRGHRTVAEAATDVIAREQALGVPEPWMGPEFIARVTAEQRARQEAAAGAPGPASSTAPRSAPTPSPPTSATPSHPPSPPN